MEYDVYLEKYLKDSQNVIEYKNMNLAAMRTVYYKWLGPFKINAAMPFDEFENTFEIIATYTDYEIIINLVKRLKSYHNYFVSEVVCIDKDYNEIDIDLLENKESVIAVHIRLDYKHYVKVQELPENIFYVAKKEDLLFIKQNGIVHEKLKTSYRKCLYFSTSINDTHSFVEYKCKMYKTYNEDFVILKINTEEIDSCFFEMEKKEYRKDETGIIYGFNNIPINRITFNF